MLAISRFIPTPQARRPWRQSSHEPYKRGLNTKLHLAVDAFGMPRVIVTQGTTADCTHAARLIEGLSAEHLLADKGYDSSNNFFASCELTSQGYMPIREKMGVNFRCAQAMRIHIGSHSDV